MLSWLGFGALKASAADRQAALDRSLIDQISEPSEAPTMIAGGGQTKAALPVRAPRFDAAIYSSRGRGYARYNEDGASLFRDAHGRMFAGVFDQAGGLGGLVRGEGSQVVAHRVFDAFKRISEAKSDMDKKIPVQITAAILAAHEELVSRAQGEVSTAVAVVFEGTKAWLVTSGDSAALHFDSDGGFKQRTESHEATGPFSAGCLLHAVGLVPEGSTPAPATWDLQEGDWVLCCSDGLLDSGLKVHELGNTLRDAETAEDALNDLCKRVLRMMSTLRAKPDNLSIVAVHCVSTDD